MVSFVAASFIGLAAVASAQNTGSIPPPSKAPSCKSAYQVCTSSYTPLDTCKAQLSGCQAVCETKWTQCTSGYAANQAECVADYANCLGSQPALNSGDSTTTDGELIVVQIYQTVCPDSGAFSYNGQQYSGTPGQPISVACPCTLSGGALYTPPAAAPGGSNGSPGSAGSPGVGGNPGAPGIPAITGNGANGGVVTNHSVPYTPVKYTGSANSVVVAGLGAVAGIAGILAIAL